jgi:ribosomal RNA-processing protein 9
VSVGRDRTSRVWKLAEDSHMIFRGGSAAGSNDCVSYVNDDWFVTGGEDGALSLYFTEKKRAVASVADAHPIVPVPSKSTNVLPTASSSSVTNWVTAVESLKSSDAVVSGGKDGYLRFWKAQCGATNKDRSLEATGAAIRMPGFVNDIGINKSGNVIVCATGDEHRLGRWEKVGTGKNNRFVIVKIKDVTNN